MKAMILAAGLGTRLKPLTDKIPKALVEVRGVPMLERVIIRLKSQGFDYIVVNVHHFADQIINFLSSKDYGVEIVISDETEKLLDTGGGIVKAYPLLFTRDSDPVLVHNVDILSNADLSILMNQNEKGSVLMVSDRDSTRKLIFDEEMNLTGWHDIINDTFRPEGFIPEIPYKEFAFSGIYTLERRSVEEMMELMGKGKFPVMDYFLNKDRKINARGYVATNLKILDIGKPATLSQAQYIF